jgi:hypothetical protein
VETFPFRSLDEFVKRAVQHGPASPLVLYRGQPCDKPLLPKVARANPRFDTTAIEKNLLKEMRRRGVTSLTSYSPGSDWELLTLAQHFGMSTRLLDWSSNPLVALWMALDGLPPNANAYVYAFMVKEEWRLEVGDKEPFRYGGTRVLQPAFTNERLAAQSGWFTAHTFSRNSGRFVPLEQNGKYKSSIWRTEIPPEERLGVLQSLSKLGINGQSLFPGLEGLCKHMNLELETEMEGAPDA